MTHSSTRSHLGASTRLGEGGLNWSPSPTVSHLFGAGLFDGDGRRVRLLEAVHRAARAAIRPDRMDAPPTRVDALVVTVLVAQVRARDGLIRLGSSDLDIWRDAGPAVRRLREVHVSARVGGIVAAVVPAHVNRARHGADRWPLVELESAATVVVSRHRSTPCGALVG